MHSFMYQVAHNDIGNEVKLVKRRKAKSEEEGGAEPEAGARNSDERVAARSIRSSGE